MVGEKENSYACSRLGLAHGYTGIDFYPRPYKVRKRSYTKIRNEYIWTIADNGDAYFTTRVNYVDLAGSFTIFLPIRFTVLLSKGLGKSSPFPLQRKKALVQLQECCMCPLNADRCVEESIGVLSHGRACWDPEIAKDKVEDFSLTEGIAYLIIKWQSWYL